MLHKGVKYSIRFQSTHPVRGATADLSFTDLRNVFQSTHPVRGATVTITGMTAAE